MMKNTIVRLSSIAALCLFANNALAGPGSVELKVKGQIGAPSCEINFANGTGVVDLGKISINNIKENSETKLPPTSGVRVQALCDAPTQLMFSVVDNRAATVSAISSKHFGLGSINGSGKLGYYGIKMMHGVVDGRSAQVYSSPSKTSFTPAAEADIETGNVMGWANSANQPLTGSNFSVQLQVIPYLASLKDMGGTIPEDSQIDGSATLNFSYAI